MRVSAAFLLRSQRDDARVARSAGGRCCRVSAEVYGNASSIHHFGQIAKQRLEMARRQMAAPAALRRRGDCFHRAAAPKRITWPFSVWRGAAARTRRHVITSAIEHPAVLNACAQLEREGVEVTCLPVGATASSSPDDVRRALRPDTALISVMHANNELGYCAADRGDRAHRARGGRPFHCDGVQALGKIAGGCARARSRSVFDQRAQNLRAEGRRRAVRAEGNEARRRCFTAAITSATGGAGTENVPGAVALGRARPSGGARSDRNRRARRRCAIGWRAGILERVPGAA